MFDERSGPLRPDLTCARNTSNLSASTEQAKLYVCVLMRYQPYLHFRNTFERYVSSLLKFGFTFEGIFCAHLLFIVCLEKLNVQCTRGLTCVNNNSRVRKKTSIGPQCLIFIMLGVQVVGHAVIWSLAGRVAQCCGCYAQFFS